ncbi:MAG: hypothetical protein HFH08_03020 [Bacilli bacterium]|nr:hypothetical protein [Bacilli bacterium]
MLTLTPKQKSLLDTIIRYREEHGYSPTYQELTNALNIKHINSIYHLIMELEKKDVLEFLIINGDQLKKQLEKN